MNYFDYFSFDKLKGPGGDTINSELDSAVFIDMNVFLYVTKTNCFWVQQWSLNAAFLRS